MQSSFATTPSMLAKSQINILFRSSFSSTARCSSSKKTLDFSKHTNLNSVQTKDSHSPSTLNSSQTSTSSTPQWDPDSALEAFFSATRPILSNLKFVSASGLVSPHLHHGDYPVGGYDSFYYLNSREFIRKLEQSQRKKGNELMRKEIVENVKAQRMKDVELTNQQVGGKIKSMFDSAEDFANYHDEFAKIFNTFAPYIPPNECLDPLEPSTNQDPASAVAASKTEPSVPQNLSEESLAILLSPVQQIPKSPIPSPPLPNNIWEKMLNSSYTSDFLKRYNVGMEDDEVEEVQTISILKRRRKKMNKHKFEKRRRENRESGRYNKEKRKHGGVIREKQD